MAKKKGQRPRGTPHEQSTIRRDQQAPPRQQKLPSGSTPHSETMPGFEGDRFHQTKQASSLPTISRSDQAGTPSLALNERVEIVGDPEARSLADEGDEGAGWTYSPIRPHNSRHLPQSIDNPEDIDWCKTRENAQTLEKKPSYRRQLQIDPKLRGAVESIASRSSFVQARSHLDLSDEPGDSLMVGTIIQHQCQYRCEDVNTPHKAGRRYKIKADVTRFEIKDRFYIVLHKNGRSITEVPIFTYGGRGLRDRQRIRHRYCSVRPPHLSVAIFRNQSERNPVLVVKELHNWRSPRDNMVAYVARVEVRKLRSLLFRRVGTFTPSSIDAVESLAAGYEAKRRYVR